MIMSASAQSPEQEVRLFVARRVAEGFDSEEDILEDTLEFFVDEYGDSQNFSSMVNRMTAELMAAHLEESRSWPEETDCDRLDKAFDEMEEQGIVARQNFTCCQNCGHAEIWEELELTRQEHEVSGYVFFHMQDTDRVLEEGRLYIAYGAADSADESAIVVAEKAAQILKKSGFNVDWDGTLDKRICLVNFNWRRRRCS